MIGGLALAFDVALDPPPPSDIVSLHLCISQTIQRARNVEQLSLTIDNGEQISLVNGFCNLRRLRIESTRDLVSIRGIPHRSDLYPLLDNAAPDNFPSFLVRLDLKRVSLISWSTSFPHVKTLTLDHIAFETSDSLPIQNTALCSSFFSSFPSLEALAIDGLDRTASTSFSLLRSRRLTRLLLGSASVVRADSDSSDEDNIYPFADWIFQLVRHFRAKIKHLTLSPRIPGNAFLHLLITSRSNGTLPLFLRALETVKVPPVKSLCLYLKRRSKKTKSEIIKMNERLGREVQRIFEEDYDLSPPEFVFWEPDEASDDVGRWEPSTWS